ncbi:methylmalonyl-CoA mutase family protein [Candidatus Leptofilum sp.]|uniref:methylmalonyl-CoA mutase family protein n=1 Tax=Candidatus Leptofilum sp. TaxID=3241576 RepID=UPI003B5A3748
MSRQTSSGIPLKSIYKADDLPEDLVDTAVPGKPPFTRGAYPGMYRTKPWRIFQLSGYGNPEDERERIKFLLDHGETGFIMEHDRNTADHLYNVDHPEVVARKEDVGLSGAVILGVRDYETILDGIPIDQYYCHPGGAVVQHGPFALACYWTVAQRRKLNLKKLAGTGQSDFFLTYLGCITKQQVPARAGLRFNCDIIEHCAQHMPRWVPVSIAAYNGADTGLNAYQELAALFANAVEYLDMVQARGNLDLAQLAHGIGGVNFRVSMDLFEDICKLRAARKMWHRLLTERYGITDRRALRLRIHVVTAGSAMTYQQPLNNIARGTLMALASVLGGVQSLGVSGYDEAISIPSEHAHQMSVRVQQILQHETNVTAVADPLGGSYFIENLTAELEERAWEFFNQIQDEGGFIATLDSGWLHQHASQNQIEQEMALWDGRKSVVGVNMAQESIEPLEINGHEPVEGVWENAMNRLETIKHSRDNKAASQALRELEQACRGDANMMPPMMTAVAADVTLGEIGDVFRTVFGDWNPPIQL